MPRNAAGLYTLPSGNPVVTGTTIDSAWANGTMDDIELQLNNVMLLSGLLPMTGALRAVTGTLSQPSYTFTGDLDTGIYSPAANTVAIVAGGQKQLEIGLGAAAFSLNAAPIWQATGTPALLTIQSRAKYLGVTLTNDDLATKGYVDSAIGGSGTLLPPITIGVDDFKLLRADNLGGSDWGDAWGPPLALTSAATLTKRRTYHVDTSGGSFTVTLPVATEAGDWVALRDATLSLQTHPLTIAPQSGEKLYGVINQQYMMDVDGEAVLFVYDTTHGWIRG